VKALATGTMDSKSAEMISRRALKRLRSRTIRNDRINRITLRTQRKRVSAGASTDIGERISTISSRLIPEIVAWIPRYTACNGDTAEARRSALPHRKTPRAERNQRQEDNHQIDDVVTVAHEGPVCVFVCVRERESGRDQRTRSKTHNAVTETREKKADADEFSRGTGCWEFTESSAR
jgi:hypothetical protein